jgi:hypothetical protein
MRYLVGFVLGLALAASPLSASAQTDHQATLAEPQQLALVPPDWDWCHDPFCPEPSKTEVAPERPVLGLDESGLEITPSAPTLEEMERRVRRARAGLATSVIVFGGGIAMMGVGFANFEPFICIFEPCPETPTWAVGLAIPGTFATIGGLVGMIVSGKRLGERKQQPRSPVGAEKAQQRRAQWDVARSRLVF